MRFLQYLNEDYLATLKSVYWRHGAEIYINPTKREYKKFNDVRFLADSVNKNIYIWDANDAIHYDIWNFLKKEGYIVAGKNYADVDLFCGIINSGKMHHDAAANLDKTATKDWSWTKKYVPGIEEYLERFLFQRKNPDTVLHSLVSLNP